MPDIHKDLRISFLLDFYGDMLTDNQKEVVTYYYNEDLSLAEIGKISGITRQGVRDSIKRAEAQLLNYEEKLGLYEKFHRIQDQLTEIQHLALSAAEENSRVSKSPEIDRKLQLIIDKTKEINI